MLARTHNSRPLIADVRRDIDFYVDPRPGDRIRAVVERIEADGHLIGYGEIQAAEYLGVQQPGG